MSGKRGTASGSMAPPKRTRRGVPVPPIDEDKLVLRGNQLGRNCYVCKRSPEDTCCGHLLSDPETTTDDRFY